MMPWVEANNQLSAKFKFADFREAFAFMTEVAFAAEELGHHPEWTNVYNTVSIYLSTHDAGNIITEKDHQLASAIDSIYRKYQA